MGSGAPVSKGVDRGAVLDAVRQLQSEGQRVSVRSVYRLVGGHYPTVGRLLRELRETGELGGEDGEDHALLGEPSMEHETELDMPPELEEVVEVEAEVPELEPPVGLIEQTRRKLLQAEGALRAVREHYEPLKREAMQLQAPAPGHR